MPNACEPEASHRRETRTRSAAQHSSRDGQRDPYLAPALSRLPQCATRV